MDFAVASLHSGDLIRVPLNLAGHTSDYVKQLQILVEVFNDWLSRNLLCGWSFSMAVCCGSMVSSVTLQRLCRMPLWACLQCNTPNLHALKLRGAFIGFGVAKVSRHASCKPCSGQTPKPPRLHPARDQAMSGVHKGLARDVPSPTAADRRVQC